MQIPFSRGLAILARVVPVVLCSVLTSCEGECDKNVSIGEWCGDPHDRCDGIRDYDAALQVVLARCAHPPSQVALQTCGKTRSIIEGGGYGGGVLTYDDEGKLVAGSTYSDISVECPAPSGGHRPTVDDNTCTQCLLCAYGAVDDQACDPKLASSLVMGCLADAPESFQGDCRSCACNECYPSFVSDSARAQSSTFADGDNLEFERCAERRCEACTPDPQPTP